MHQAFTGFDDDKVDRMLEESLSLRSVERTVDEVLIPAVEELAPSDDSPASPEFQFAWRYATGWLAAAQRVAPPAHRTEAILIFEATHNFDVDALHCQALELTLRRAGLRTLTLAVAMDTQRLGRAMRALKPGAVVLTGRRASLDALGRLVYAARQSGGELEVFDYRGALPDTGASTVCRLASTPLLARDTLLGSARNRTAAERPRRAAEAEAGASAAQAV